MKKTILILVSSCCLIFVFSTQTAFSAQHIFDNREIGISAEGGEWPPITRHIAIFSKPPHNIAEHGEAAWSQSKSISWESHSFIGLAHWATHPVAGLVVPDVLWLKHETVALGLPKCS